MSTISDEDIHGIVENVRAVHARARHRTDAAAVEMPPDVVTVVDIDGAWTVRCLARVRRRRCARSPRHVSTEPRRRERCNAAAGVRRDRGDVNMIGGNLKALCRSRALAIPVAGR